MNAPERQWALEKLSDELIEKIQQYDEYLKNDESHEVRKELRRQIREIQKQIADLRESVDGQLR